MESVDLYRAIEGDGALFAELRMLRLGLLIILKGLLTGVPSRVSLYSIMVIKHSVEGYDAFNKTIKEIETTAEAILVLFSGSKTGDGKSWCPDCVSAEPVINRVLETLDDKTAFLYVGVGDRATWKDPNCVFRKDERLRLSSVPTLVRWGKPNRLQEEECCNTDLIRLLLEDD